MIGEISRETLETGYWFQASAAQVWKAIAKPLLMRAILDDAPFLKELEADWASRPSAATSANDEVPMTAAFADAVRAQIAAVRAEVEGRLPPSAA